MSSTVKNRSRRLAWALTCRRPYLGYMGYKTRGAIAKRKPLKCYNEQRVRSFGRVAQLGEHLLCKQGVAGSIPVTSTNLIPALSIIYAAISTALFWCNFGTFGTTDTLLKAGGANP